MVAVPAATPVTAKAPVRLPLGIVMLGAETVAIALDEDESATVRPPLPAGALSVTVPFIVRPTPTAELAVDTVRLAAETLTVAKAGR